MAAGTMISILHKIAQRKPPGPVHAEQAGESQASKTVEQGSQLSLPRTTSRSSSRTPKRAEKKDKKNQKQPRGSEEDRRNWLAERIFKYITDGMNKVPPEGQRNLLEILYQVINRHTQMSACLTRSLGEVCGKTELEFNCCGEPSSTNALMSSAASSRNLRLADAMVERVGEILSPRLDVDVNTAHELKQRLHELAMLVVTIEGDDFEDSEQGDDGIEDEEAVLMQKGQGGSVPPWRSSWSGRLPVQPDGRSFS